MKKRSYKKLDTQYVVKEKLLLAYKWHSGKKKGLVESWGKVERCPIEAQRAGAAYFRRLRGKLEWWRRTKTFIQLQSRNLLAKGSVKLTNFFLPALPT